MTVSQPAENDDECVFLDSVEGEIAFFRSIMRARPVGMHRHFHVLAIRTAIAKETGKSLHIDTIWEKLRKYYDLDALDAIEFEAEGYLTAKSNNSTPVSIRSPSPSENLAGHPFFREEFTLPWEDFEAIISQRRMRDSASVASSPAASPGAGPTPTTANTTAATATAATTTTTTTATTATTTTSASTGKRGPGRKRGKVAKSKLNLAGLVAGDSDSSALTQDSGDEGGVPETPRESVVTGTDAGTDYAEDEDVEMREPSPVQEASPKPGRGRPPKGGRRGRAAAPARGTSRRGVKTRKR